MEEYAEPEREPQNNGLRGAHCCCGQRSRWGIEKKETAPAEAFVCTIDAGEKSETEILPQVLLIVLSNAE